MSHWRLVPSAVLVAVSLLLAWGNFTKGPRSRPFDHAEEIFKKEVESKSRSTGLTC
jgi:hypothetical protein